MTLAAGFVLNQELNWVNIQSPFLWIILTEFVLKSSRKAMGEHWIKWREKTLLNLDFSHDLSFLDESLKKMIELSEVLRVKGAKIDSLINVK